MFSPLHNLPLCHGGVWQGQPGPPSAAVSASEEGGDPFAQSGENLRVAPSSSPAVPELSGFPGAGGGLLQVTCCSLSLIPSPVGTKVCYWKAAERRQSLESDRTTLVAA